MSEDPLSQFFLRNDNTFADPQSGKVIFLDEFVDGGVRDSHEIDELLHTQQQRQIVIAGINAFLQIVGYLLCSLVG